MSGRHSTYCCDGVPGLDISCCLHMSPECKSRFRLCQEPIGTSPDCPGGQYQAETTAPGCVSSERRCLISGPFQYAWGAARDPTASSCERAPLHTQDPRINRDLPG